MSRWFRCYDDAINDPKILKLPEATRWHWIALLCLASKNNGVLPCIDDVALMLRVPAAKANLILSTLKKAGLLDDTEAGVTPHNWQGRQYKSDVTDPTNAVRQKRYRNRHRNDSNAVTDKRPDTESDTETEKKDASCDATSAVLLDPDARFYRRAKEVLGPKAGGLSAQLLRAKGGVHSQAIAAIEVASGKENPTEYIGAIIRNAHAPPGKISDGRSW